MCMDVVSEGRILYWCMPERSISRRSSIVEVGVDDVRDASKREKVRRSSRRISVYP